MEAPILVPIIVALLEGLKGFKINRAYFPFISVVVGLSVSFLFIDCREARECIFEGITMGLAAMGLYNLALKPIKRVIEKKNEEA